MTLLGSISFTTYKIDHVSAFPTPLEGVPTTRRAIDYYMWLQGFIEFSVSNMARMESTGPLCFNIFNGSILMLGLSILEVRETKQVNMSLGNPADNIWQQHMIMDTVHMSHVSIMGAPPSCVFLSL